MILRMKNSTKENIGPRCACGFIIACFFLNKALGLTPNDICFTRSSRTMATPRLTLNIRQVFKTKICDPSNFVSQQLLEKQKNYRAFRSTNSSLVRLGEVCTF
jgi:hypothetical protein